MLVPYSTMMEAVRLVSMDSIGQMESVTLVFTETEEYYFSFDFLVCLRVKCRKYLLLWISLEYHVWNFGFTHPTTMNDIIHNIILYVLFSYHFKNSVKWDVQICLQGT